MNEIFWEQVKRMVKIKGITQSDLADACQVPLSTLKGWIKRNYFPTVVDGYLIALKLGVSVEYLITGKESAAAGNIRNIRVLLRRAERKLDKIG